MKIRFQNRTSGERIRHLMDSKNIKNAPDLVREMVKDGILEKKKFEGDYLRYTADTINKHLADKQLPDRKWIDLYCDFFDCSADYLMGYIDYPTHSTTNICQDTGLSAPAAEQLQTWNQEKPRYTEILSDILTSKEFFQIMNQFFLLYCQATAIKTGKETGWTQTAQELNQNIQKWRNKNGMEKDYRDDFLKDYIPSAQIRSGILALLDDERIGDVIRNISFDISRLSGNLAESYYQSKAGD